MHPELFPRITVGLVCHLSWDRDLGWQVDIGARPEGAEWNEVQWERYHPGCLDEALTIVDATVDAAYRKGAYQLR